MCEGWGGGGAHIWHTIGATGGTTVRIRKLRVRGIDRGGYLFARQSVWGALFCSPDGADRAAR